MADIYSPGTLVGHRYRIVELLGRGGMGAVFLAHDRLDDKLVALKSVLSSKSRANPSPEAVRLPPLPQGSEAALAATFAAPSATSDGGPRLEQAETATSHQLPLSRKPAVPANSADRELRLALTREFATLASLRHPHIVSVLDYGFDAGRPFFTMELLSQARSLLQAAEQSSLQGKVLLLAQIAQALAYLHRRRILHRDLKPANVLVVEAAAERQAKVLDFGLAIERDLSTSEVAGTLAYLAPELLHGSRPSEASDLYALGMIAFELLSGGRHPLEQCERAGVGQLITAILSLKVDTSGLNAPPLLRELVARLLCPDPALRPSDASALVGELHRCAGLSSPVEEVSIRDSYLQAARFVSRQEELQSLLSALRDAMRGHGGICLIGGESGVGKSRLLDELRTQALVHGAQVLRGQAIREGAGAFHLFRPVIEALCLDVPLDDASLAVLQSLFPRPSGLLPRASSSAPPLDGQILQERTLSILDHLLDAASGDPQHPLVVLLEDLQWAGKETLTLLTRLAGWIGQHALLVIGTYRDDEQPNLPATLPEASVLKLRRLDAASTATLSESMLGLAGKSEELVSFLHRESAGNPFFIVEILRALAEEVGQLGAIAEDRLPEHILTGGVRAILERRINRLPTWARPLLELAAVAGKQIDKDMLVRSETGRGLEEHSLDDWLLRCADLSILEVHDQRWQFSHDKLRECVIEQVGAAERLKPLHYEVAQTLQRTYTDVEHSTHALLFAHHLLESVPLFNADEALGVALEAAERTMQQAGFAEAAALLERAILVSDSASIDERTRCELFLRLGKAQIRSGNHERGKQAGTKATELAHKLGDWDRLARAALTYGLEITPALSDQRLITLLEDALRVLPDGDHPLRAQVLARLAAALIPSPNPPVPIAMASEALAMARRLADPALLRTVLVPVTSAVTGYAPPDERRLLNQELVTLALAAGDRVQALRGYRGLISACLGAGDLASVDANIEAYSALSRELRQVQYEWPERMLRSMRAATKGQFAEAEKLASEGEAIARRTRDPNVPLTIMLRWQRLLVAEQPAQLLALEPQFRALLSRIRSPYVALEQRALALCHARAGNFEAARESLHAWEQGSLPTIPLSPLFRLAETCFLLAEVKLAEEIYKCLLPFPERMFEGAGMFVMGPVTHALGLVSMTLGRWDEAVRYFEDALSRSESNGLLCCVARLRYEYALALLGRRGRGSDKEDYARAHQLLGQARELATDLGQTGLLPLIAQQIQSCAST